MLGKYKVLWEKLTECTGRDGCFSSCFAGTLAYRVNRMHWQYMVCTCTENSMTDRRNGSRLFYYAQ
jgi:hypothetical protein